MKNLAMLPDYFDYIFVHLRQKVRLRPESSPKFLSTLSPNPARTRTRPEKPGPTYNSEAKDRNARGQGQEPRTQAQVFSKKKIFKVFFRRSPTKKRSPKTIFRRSPKEVNKKGLRKFYARFLAFSNKILTIQKILQSSSRGQSNFRGLEASRPRTRPSRPRPRTSKCILKAEDVLENSTSDYIIELLIREWLLFIDSLRPQTYIQ